MVKLRASRAYQLVTKAANVLMSLTLPADRRLVAALREISLLSQEEGKLSREGQELFTRLMREVGSEKSFDERVAEFGQSDLDRISTLIDELIWNTVGHYYTDD